MQSLDVISINLWQTLISLANLVLLFLLIKKFLYKPVKKMLENRQKTIDADYAAAHDAKAQAQADMDAYAKALSDAKSEADGIIKSAVNTAKLREKEILADAKSEADGILQRAEENAALEIKKAEKVIKDEIVDVSTSLTKKLLEHEITAQDHQQLIDSFINEIGEDNDADL